MSEKSEKGPEKLNKAYLSDIRGFCSRSLKFIYSCSFSESNLRFAFDIVNDLVKKFNELSTKNLNLNPEHLASLSSICMQANMFSNKCGINRIEESYFKKYINYIYDISTKLIATIDTIPSDPVFFKVEPDEGTREIVDALRKLNEIVEAHIQQVTAPAEENVREDFHSEADSSTLGRSFSISFTAADLPWDANNDDGNSSSPIDLQRTVRNALLN